MGRHILSLAAGVVIEHAPETAIHAAARAGYDAVGIWIEPELWTDQRAHDVRKRVADHGLMVLDAEVFWIRPGPFDPSLKRAIDIAALVGAPNILVVSTDPDLDATAEKFGAICDHARPADIAVSLEFGAFSDVTDLAKALRVVRAADRPNGRILVDPLHLARTGGTPADIAALPVGVLSYAQFCDAPATGPSPEDRLAIRTEAVDARLVTGEGGLPLGPLLDALPADMPLSLEIRSKALRDSFPEPTERAARVLTAMRQWLGRRGK